MKVIELKEELRWRQLKTSGNKSILVNRLLEECQYLYGLLKA